MGPREAVRHRPSPKGEAAGAIESIEALAIKPQKSVRSTIWMEPGLGRWLGIEIETNCQASQDDRDALYSSCPSQAAIPTLNSSHHLVQLRIRRIHISFDGLRLSDCRVDRGLISP